MTDLSEIAAGVTECRRCPRLVAWREEVAIGKRAAFRDEAYWGRPVPGFGDPGARVLVLGLAPAAHGANRTGRQFTGDRSGDWLFRALYRAGFANQEHSVHAGDGLALKGAYVTSAVKCAPPANKPTTDERNACAAWFHSEWDLLTAARVVVCLGQFAYQALWRELGSRDVPLPRPRPVFGHGVEIRLDDGYVILLSYHPSQQNTFTGKLTESMLDQVFARAAELSRS